MEQSTEKKKAILILLTPGILFVAAIVLGIIFNLLSGSSPNNEGLFSSDGVIHKIGNITIFVLSMACVVSFIPCLIIGIRRLSKDTNQHATQGFIDASQPTVPPSDQPQEQDSMKF